jgi:hypothetical protein
MNKDTILYIEPPVTKIIGVVGKNIYLLTHGYEDDADVKDIDDCVVIITESTYKRLWKKWIEGKRDYCERFNHFCGVMGYFTTINPIPNGTISITKYNENKKDYDFVEVPLYIATEFTENPEFEYG